MAARLSQALVLVRIPKRSWILQSKTRAWLFAAMAGLGVAIGTSLAEWFFYEEGQPPMVMMIASDIFAGALACLLIAGALGNIVDRAEAVHTRLETVAQMNHHVRNALQLISFSAYSTHDQETITKVREGTERIEWALREILESGAVVPVASRKSPDKAKPPGTERPPGEVSA